MYEPLLKPKDQKRVAEAVKVFPDGREVCNLKTAAGRREYRRRHREAFDRDKQRPHDDYSICGICKKSLRWEESTPDHIRPKGHGGGFHDDRVSNLQPAHAMCNGEKGSKRL